MTTTIVDDRNDCSALETMIARGDRDAMARYLAISLSPVLSSEELRRRYDVVWNANHGNDSMVLRNLSMVSAAAGETAKTKAYAQDFIENGFLSDAFNAAMALKEYGGEEDACSSDDILTEIASKGHILSQVYLRSKSALHAGLAGRLGFQLYRAYKIAQATVLVCKNPTDQRVLK